MGLAQQKTEVVNLSFESYLKDSVECFNAISTVNKEIERTRESFTNEIKIIKESFSIRSTEDEKTQDKKNFGVKIKEFFLKIWGFLVKVFRTISDIVISLIKSIMIFVQKKRLQMNSIFKLVEKAGGIKAFNTTSGDIIAKVISAEKSIKTLVSHDGKTPMNHGSLEAMFRSKILESFVNLKIEYNRNSENSVVALKAKLDELTKSAGDQATNRKLSILESAVNDLYKNGILFNEASTDKNSDAFFKPINVALNVNENNSTGTVYEGKIDELGNIISFGMNKKKYENITLKRYFSDCISGSSVDWPTFARCFHEYYEISEKVIGKNGYIKKLEKTLKEYSKKAKEDHKMISEMNKAILAEVNKYVDSETPEAKSKLSLFNRFTNIVSKVKRIKTHFIRLRQTVILNIMSMYSIENKAWWTLLKGGKAMGGNVEDETNTVTTNWKEGMTNDITTGGNFQFAKDITDVK